MTTAATAVTTITPDATRTLRTDWNGQSLCVLSLYVLDDDDALPEATAAASVVGVINGGVACVDADEVDVVASEAVVI